MNFFRSVHVGRRCNNYFGNFNSTSKEASQNTIKNHYSLFHITSQNFAGSRKRDKTAIPYKSLTLSVPVSSFYSTDCSKYISRMTDLEDKLSAKEKEQKVCRIVIQQCLNATLRFDTENPPVSIGRGIVVYVCFLQSATRNSIPLIAKSILHARLSESEDDTPSRKSVLELNNPSDVLLIPQATLGGKLKGKNVQYHGIVSKPVGADLFRQLVEDVSQLLAITQPSPSGHQGQVRCGVYGARQILSMETNGPYTHVFDF